MARWSKKLTIYHRVQKGERLCQIAKKYNVTIKQIAEFNGLTNIDYIYKGQLLKIK